jgi:hypothetical protein
MADEPLTYEQLYGEPEPEPDKRNGFFDPDDDELLETLLEPADDNFDDAHICPNCQQPYHLCQCDLIDTGEDY